MIDVVISRFGRGAESTWQQGYTLAPERTRKV